MPQRHDLGRRKRFARTTTTTRDTPEELARALVARGLASKQILTPRKDNQ